MCIAMLTSPFVVYSLIPNSSPREWSIVFVLHALLLLLCNAVFCFIGSGRPAHFTRNQQEKEDQSMPILVNVGGNNDKTSR